MASDKTFSLSSISGHKIKKDLWIAIHGKVYDVTKYTEEHPGGLDSLLEVAGKDATSAFEDVGHSADAREVMESFMIGNLEGGSSEPATKKRSPIPVKAQHRASHKEENDKSGLHKLLSREFAIPFAVAAVPIVGLISFAKTLGSGDLAVHLGGFWSGSFVSGVVLATIGIALFFNFEKALNTYPDFRSFPAHRALTTPVAEKTGAKGVLEPQIYQRFPLVRRDNLSNNVFRFVFELPSSNSVLGLPIGQHVAIRANVSGKTISRSYTPVSNNSDLGELRLAVKIYPDGALTGGYLGKLKIGDEVEFRGPKGAMRYRKGRFDNIGMIAGGTGITPMYQLIRAICEDDTDNATISLVFANPTEDDIILRKQLEDFQQAKPNKFKIHYMLDSPPRGWSYGKGFVTKDVLEQHMPPASKRTQILLCGPPGMVNACKKSLADLGYEKPENLSKATDQVFLF